MAEQHAAHVKTFEVAYEVADYYANLRAADTDDYGDQCYYSDRAADNLERLSAMGEHMVVYALTARRG